MRHDTHPARAAATGRGVAEVLAALTGREVPMTAQQLFFELRDDRHRLGLATIYRALHVLRDAGRVHTFPGSAGVAFRVCADQPHYHLICADCGRVQERRIVALGEWLEALAPGEFTAHSCTVEVYGTCQRCRDRTDSPRDRLCPPGR